MVSLRSAVYDHTPPDGFALIKPAQNYFGKQGMVYGASESREAVGAQKICMNVMSMRRAHWHSA